MTQSVIYTVSDQLLIAESGFLKYIVGHQIGLPWMAYANAQASKIFVIAQTLNGVTQAIVATVTAAFLKANSARVHI